MITGLLTALIVIAIVCVIVYAIFSFIPMPAPVSTVIWCITAVICLLILLHVMGGGSLGIT